MGFFNFAGITQWVVGNGYWLLFLAMIIEGPVVTAAAAFAAALGLLDIWAVFLISILGNLIPDAIYYALGYWGRENIINNYGHYFRLTKEKVAELEAMIQKHAGKSLIAIKLVPFLATPGLIIAGASRMEIKKYIFWSIAVTLPSSLLYLLVGYYSGAAYSRFIHYINIGGYIIAGGILLFILVGYLEKKFGEDWAKRMNKEK